MEKLKKLLIIKTPDDFTAIALAASICNILTIILLFNPITPKNFIGVAATLITALVFDLDLYKFLKKFNQLY